MKVIHMISFILLVVGGLNWLLFGIIGKDIGEFIGGMDSIQAKIIYILVGLAAIFEVVTHKNNCKGCSAKPQGGASAQIPTQPMGGGGQTGM